jgi:putative PIG3 family NAD(P)H quinone oxidoreductase
MQMRAVIFDGAGGPDVIRVGLVPKPAVAPGQVRVRVHAAALNRADLMQRRGQYPAPPGWPSDIPGLEFAGEVEAVYRDDITRWSPGDRVMGLAGGGGQAEYVVASEDELIPVPEGLGLEEAAAIPESFLTAYDALVVRARLREGERILIHAVGSGLGTAAAQLARRAGATVIGTSRSADKLARATVFGVDIGIDTSGGGFRAAVHEPVDVILDVLGGEALADNLALLADRGRLLLLGLLAGSWANVDLGLILRKRIEVIGTVMRPRGPAERAALAREFTDVVVPLFEHGVLRPVVDRVVPVEEIRAAHTALEANDTFGKIVVVW